MGIALLPAVMARLDNLEVRLCRPANATARQHRPVRRFFALVSRLGDGIAWYATLALLPLFYGFPALAASLQMALTGALGVLLYKALKQRLVRERPFHAQPGVRAIIPPLDRYSFPSGHTLHAVCFTTLLGHLDPALLWLAVPFAASVAASRVVLGLHYPSDVLAGGILGWSLASLSVALLPL